MTNWRMGVVLASLLSGCFYFAVQANGQQSQGGASSKSTKTHARKATAKQADPSEGERLFEQNCGRCHYPPEDLSPREARAVLRQMRVRALLSAEEERLILKYIAP